MNRTSLIILCAIGLGFLIFTPFLGEWAYNKVNIPVIPGVNDDLLGISVVVEYADGTEETIGPHENSLLPLSVTFGGKEIEGINIQLEALLTWEGDYDVYSCDTTIHVLWDSVERATFGNSRSTPTGFSPAPASGVWVRLDGNGVPARQMDQWAFNYPTGSNTHSLKFSCDASVTISFPDGSQALRSGTCSAEITVSVDESADTVSAMSLNTEATPLTP